MKKVALLAVFLSTPSFSVTSLVFNGVTGRNSNAVRNFDLSVVRHLNAAIGMLENDVICKQKMHTLT